ncbi:mandelate racemase/muconate lactonizing enzyme family protein [Pseudomonas sp. EpS/L25]|uniref:mandelate racemase/muconate lactonizing enzyme family protein n=1 Tax=Pseudomonas sp. EpS/L25 TaxID=1749078 RepID=UPI0009E814B0|nr:enolase C-terminal domain-like protein [Pseudomonas sp. EpS/L25]
MRIRMADIYLVEIPYKQAYKTSTNMTKKGRHVLLRVELEDGTEGWGETGIISQRYPAEGDSPETIFAVLEHYFCPALIGMCPLVPAVIMEVLDRALRGHQFAKCAIDHALLDLQGKILGTSVSNLLGGSHRNEYDVSRSLPIDKPEKVANRALQLRDEGYKRLTLKGVGNVTEDYAVFHAVRKALGEGFELEIDPNGAYDAPSAVNLLRKLEQLDLYAVEQPTAGNDLRALSEVKSKVSVSVIADESVFTTRDLREIIKLDAADTICLKPFKNGGILASRKLQHAAECSGLRVSTGSMHPFGIGTAALHIFAAGISDLMTAGYGSPSERFADDVVDEASYRFENGTVKINNDRPGLGVLVNKSKVQRYTSKYASVSQRNGAIQ